MEEIYDGFKLVFVDVDGTVLTSTREILPKTIYTFEELKKMGVEVVICSGRQRSNCTQISKIIGAGRYIISANGADVYDRILDKKIYGEFISVELLKKVKDIANKYNIRYRMICGNTAYINKDIKSLLDETLLNEEDFNDEFFETHKIPQIVLSCNDLEIIQKVRLEILKLPQLKIINQNKNPQKSKDFFLDITNKDTSKGNAIKKLCKYLDIPTDYTVAFGDGNNDISMFETVGVGVAMGNSTQMCLESASVITTSNDDDGIYNACLNLFDIMECLD